MLTQLSYALKTSFGDAGEQCVPRIENLLVGGLAARTFLAYLVAELLEGYVAHLQLVEEVLLLTLVNIYGNLVSIDALEGIDGTLLVKVNEDAAVVKDDILYLLHSLYNSFIQTTADVATMITIHSVSDSGVVRNICPPKVTMSHCPSSIATIMISIPRSAHRRCRQL